jgi:transposase
MTQKKKPGPEGIVREINPNLYYRWSKSFLEAGKKRLSGDTQREATTDEVGVLRRENEDLKKLLAESWLSISRIHR